MGNRKRMIWLPVLLMLLVCVMPAVHASAETADGMWLRTKAEDGTVVAAICVNTTVSDGMIELQYNNALLAFAEVTVDSQYVAAHAVNAQEEGLIKIAWVAPGDYDREGTVHILMQVRFTGTEVSAVAMTGVAHTPDGNALPVVELHPEGVFQSLASAAEYISEDYTAESFAVLEAACANAQALLGDVYADQAALDAAAAAVMAAIEGLVKAEAVPPTVPPTEPTQPATQPTQPATTTPTQPTQPDVEPAPDPQPNGGLWIGIAAALVVAGAAVVVIMKKKEVRK